MSAIKELSAGLAAAVKTAAPATVTVDARDGYPASGVAYRADRVLTASHVVQREEDIQVVLPEGRLLQAVLAGRDPVNDLAVLRLAETAATAAVTAESAPAVGDLVLALARPSEEGIQASLGIVGIVGGRYEGWHGAPVEGVMRIDAASFPGFSGGPLVNVEGAVVGINTAGGRFAVPVRPALEVAERLDREGSPKHGYLGMRSQPVEIPASVSLDREQSTGLLVVAVEKDGPSERAGLLVGDILVGLAGAPVEDHETLLALLAGKAAETVEAEIIRGGSTLRLTLTLGEAEAGPGPFHGAHGRFRRFRGPHAHWRPFWHGGSGPCC